LIEEEREGYAKVPRVHHAISSGVDDTGDEKGGIEFDEVKNRCFRFDTEKAGGGFTEDGEELMRIEPCCMWRDKDLLDASTGAKCGLTSGQTVTSTQ
jgi:hypothetical protein